ncbi:electron transport complex subunit RsxG [Parendozoicomonas haliclonae]|uniref:Ion-translocating oxidoreductase complex subunit G n=1 Tax=Parendozoicomonas haliclonae TaxID=1960125 RepID=A0A1X7AHN4_9GAMM|nr:electron transport complex subunit RsxG [Parendozoicomonas haliclonae]SMA43301.1 Electron transport complex protein RnfG [Parendozoicomonas haliclonae]
MSTEKLQTSSVLAKAISKNSLTLALFALLTVGLVSFTWLMTKERIAEQIRLSEQKALFEVLPANQFDNKLLDTTVIPPEPELLGPISEQARVWVAFKQGQPAAVILPVVAPDGYNGRIQLLVGITREGVITGVRVVSHKETPGLGDDIETRVSNWILDFTGKSLLNPENDGWAVEKDGGDFDQFTGATVTPRAVVNAVYRALNWFDEYRTQVFAEAGEQLAAQSKGD